MIIYIIVGLLSAITCFICSTKVITDDEQYRERYIRAAICFGAGAILCAVVILCTVVLL